MSDARAAECGNRLADEITADNSGELLASIACPHCGSIGALGTFHEPNNNGTGVICRNCNIRHPLRGILWLRRGEKKQKRSNDIAAVIEECGAYCYVCGTDFEILRRLGIGRHVHHTRAFAEHGDAFRKIPMCALCHEIASAMQRQIGKLLTVKSADDELIELIRQEFVRTLGSWFVGTTKGEQALDRIMRCVGNAIGRHADGLTNAPPNEAPR
jgi:hypothetical protein